MPFRRMKIRQKLLLILILLALVPMLLLVVITFGLFSNEMESYAGERFLESVNQIGKHVDSYLDELNRLSMLPYYQQDLLSILREDDSKDLLQQYYNTKRVESILLSSMLNPREDLRSVFVYRNDGRVMFISRGQVYLNEHDRYHHSLWYRKALEAGGKAVFVTNDPGNRFAVKPKNMFSIARLIKTYDQKILGAIIIDADFSGLEAIFREINLGECSNLVVLNQDHEIIYRQNDQFTNLLDKESISSIAAIQSGMTELKTDRDSILAAIGESRLTGWKIVGLIEARELNKPFAALRNTLWWLSLSIIIAIIIVSLFFSRMITRPLVHLTRLMRDMQRGKFDVKMPELKQQDEISLVATTFNKMIEQIESLIQQVADIRVKQTEAELNELKAQINPHFLYNTLESIRALADLNDQFEIMEAVSSLGNLFRYSIESRNQLVKLRDELNHVQNYFNLLRICSEQPLRLIIDAHESVLDAHTLPIMLQPVIENAIRHGHRETVQERLIHCKAVQQENDLKITVTDNGKGMPAPIVEQLNRELAEAMENLDRNRRIAGVGLSNVAHRIALTFGKPYGIRIESEENQGTVVTIHVPFIRDSHALSQLILNKGRTEDADSDDHR